MGRFTAAHIIRGISYCILIILVAGFFVQVWDGWEKYVNAYTTTTSYIEKDDKLSLPFVTFCPGFKPHAFDNADRQFDTSFPDLLQTVAPGHVTATKIDDWWREHTFTAEETFDSIKLISKGAERTILTASNSWNGSLVEESVSAGRCYTVVSKEPRTRALVAKLNHTLTHRIAIFAAYNSPQLGLYFNRWTLPSLAHHIDAGDKITLGLTKTDCTSYHRDGDVCDPSINGDGHLACIKSWFQREYVTKSSCKLVCSFPLADYMLSGLSLPRCLKKSDFACNQRHFDFLKDFITNPERNGCALPCRFTKLNMLTGVSQAGPKLVNASVAIFYFSTPFVTVTKEVLIYDLNAIISAIGGSLGLFLGFSCYGCIEWMLGNVQKRVGK